MRAKKHLGQNFLNKSIIHKKFIPILKTMNLKIPIIEIGPGKGVLTKELQILSSKLIIIEKDKDLIPLLKELKTANTKIITGDALIHEPEEKKYNIIANIPYYITSPLLFRYLIHPFTKQVKFQPPQEALILVQSEFAEKLINKEPNNNILSISFQSFYEIKIVANINRKYFSPIPKVNSALVYFKQRTNPLINNNIIEFINYIRNIFQQKNKNILKLTANYFNIEKAQIASLLDNINIDQKSRPRHLDIKSLKSVFNHLQNHQT